MDISELKNFIKKTSGLKNYSSLLVPLVIGLVAVLAFIPTQLMSGQLKEQIATESISKRGRRVKSLNRTAVSSRQWKVEQQYQQAFKIDANQAAVLAKQSTQRQLLSYRIFPKPKDTSALLFEQFGQQFRNAVEELIRRVNARDCPSDVELKRSLKGSGSSSRSIRSRFNRSVSSFQNLSGVDATIRDALCRQKAESASVYANPADLSGYEYWGQYKYDTSWTEAVENCWYWQLSYWIIEDVIDTVATRNSGSQSVFTSPIKRILLVSFGGETEKSSRKKKIADKPAKYVLSSGDGLVQSCTARYSNDDIDVVHFNVNLVVSTKAILPFMRELCSAKQHRFRGFSDQQEEQIFRHNQITILAYDIISIDRESQAHSLYRYGDDAVVELDLICEYVFNKKGYDEVKPESVKESLKKSESEASGKRY